MFRFFFVAGLAIIVFLTSCDVFNIIEFRNNSNFDIIIQADESLEKRFLENSTTSNQWAFFKSGIKDSIHSYTLPPKTVIQIYGELGNIPSNKPPIEYLKVIMNKDTLDLHSYDEIVSLLNQSIESRAVFYLDIRDTTQFK